MQPENLTETANGMRRLYWACRRGMLELDVLLGNFLSAVYPSLDQAQQLQFEQLLTYPDPEIYDWLMGNAAPADGGLATMAEQIRLHARLSCI